MLKEQINLYAKNLKGIKEDIVSGVKGYKSNITKKISGKIQESSSYFGKAKHAAIIIGSIWVVYKLTDKLFGDTSQKVEIQPTEEPEQQKVVVVNKNHYDLSIVRKIKQSIASFIITLAKKELMRAIERMRDRSE